MVWREPHDPGGEELMTAGMTKDDLPEAFEEIRRASNV